MFLLPAPFRMTPMAAVEILSRQGIRLRQYTDKRKPGSLISHLLTASI